MGFAAEHQKQLREEGIALDSDRALQAASTIQTWIRRCLERSRLDSSAREAELAFVSKNINQAFQDKLQNGGADLKDPTQLRDRRIAFARIFTKCVAEYRSAWLPSMRSESETSDITKARVFVRSRPLFQHEADRGEWECVSSSPKNLGVVLHEGLEKVQKPQGLKKTMRHHAFNAVDSILDDDDAYDHVRYLMTGALEGRTSTLFMLGMTGSGKTYTMNAIHSRAPSDLFAASGSQPIKMTAYELIGKRCFDLLSDTKCQLHLRMGDDGLTHVCGGVERVVHSADELRDLLRTASAHRETAATGTNATSSRSHAVYHLSFLNGGNLLMIDLAGNEGNIESQWHSKEQMAEAAYINTSLMVLNTCLHARAIDASHIPFRQSILTRVLRDTLVNPQSSIAVLACVSPACSHFERSLATLRTAVNLLGDNMGPIVAQEVLREVGVKTTKPALWTSEELGEWLALQPFGHQIVLPPGMSGASIMRLTAARLAPMCRDDKEVAKDFFDALRVAAKKASEKDLEQRRELKNGNRSSVCSVGFSKVAPAKPIVARHKS